MLPLSDVIPARTTPFVTITIIAGTTLLFVAGLALGPSAARDLAHTFAFSPAPFSIAGAFTSLLLPPSGWQLLLNLLMLRIFGETLEDRLGRARFALIAVAAGLAAVAGHTALTTAASAPVANASTMVAGVLGGYFVLYPQSKVLTLAPVSTLVAEVPAVFYLAIWWVVEILSRLREMTRLQTDGPGNPALWALGAAFVAGALLTKLLRRPLRWDDRA